MSDGEIVASVKAINVVGSFMVANARPEADSRMKGRRTPQGVFHDACCFLRRHDPFQVRRVEQPSVPQSQSSAEDTPTGTSSGTSARKRRKRKSGQTARTKMPPTRPEPRLGKVVDFEQGRPGRGIFAP